ncbi:hypothetical protein E2553_36805 [Paraburkholderia dipogonis]|uniref:Uncharacterized protein n=1 Tax=Paraburkholderia dipogonis TaxID=1211383 RepID=A0A4Y8MXS1_9BURK|nr:hypothetical protein [Paraburkholderia dipogonis]TFE42165.1 hypothetical protein E2553_36805 [Paraburkholderia dipogonis]
MQQYVFSMTSRMMTIAAACALLLCVLLFVLGIEIGARFSADAPRDASTAPAARATVATGSVAPQPALPGASDLAPVPASSTL